SRLDRKFLEGKKVFLVSASTGARGGMSSLEVVKNLIPRFGGEVVDTFSFPSFKENFSLTEKAITNEELKIEILLKLHQFENKLK
ncbi:MAG TPA: NADPH-dependent FMN reductase, partial [Flavobacterium sp.]|nr:NADPH-dependent FMN reductase [Flavobacterium sp.]